MIEILEHRTLFAVTVTEGFSGFYEVAGDASDDIITLSVNQSARTFSLGGAVYANVSFINVYGNGGADTIGVTGIGTGPVGVGLTGGDGDDVLTLTRIGGGAWGGAGRDRIELTDSFRGQAYGEDGADYILVYGACADADLRGGEGDDTLYAEGSTVSVVMFGDDGRDRLYGSPFADQLDGGPGRDYLFGRAGNDVIYSRYADLDYVVGGDGVDVCFCDPFESALTDVEVILPG